tara:strand:- start:274 stop:405 length:132 start_codon:yes stop_codon:yes gene_type:complete
MTEEICAMCGVTGEGAAAWAGYCHDCENQACPECGEIECVHEF